jgi:hypothetical protein
MERKERTWSAMWRCVLAKIFFSIVQQRIETSSNCFLPPTYAAISRSCYTSWMSSVISKLEHVEAFILIATPIAGIVALVMDFSWTNLLLLSILLVVWKIANGAL